MSSKETGAKTSTQVAPDAKEKLVVRLNDFMHANRKVFLAIGIVILASIVGLGIFSIVSADRLAKSTLALEKLEKQVLAWKSANETDKAAKGTELVTEADTIVARYGRQYAAIRASIIKAEVLAASNDAPGAEKAYAAAAKAYPKSHIAPVALANAAALAEDRGDADAALSYLEKAQADYPDAPGSGRILLSIGRMHEATRQYAKALDAYTKLVAKGNESDWTKIAHDRIILIKSQGLGK